MSLSSSVNQCVNSIKEFNENTKAFFSTVSNIIYYLTHPKQLGLLIWNGLVEHSFEICLLICLLSIVAYLVGYERGKKVAKGSVLTYIVVQMFNSALS